MKKIMMISVGLLMKMSVMFAQNPNYTKAMEGLVTEIQSTQFGTPLQPLANKMERIAATEKTEWLPNYWVAYCYLMDCYAETDVTKKDMLLDKADIFLDRAEDLTKNNDEIEVLKANLASGRMTVNPADRWQKYGEIVVTALNNAKKINPENPRIALLEAQGIFYTPEAYGGGKEKSKPIFEKSIQQFSKFKPASNIQPNWGEIVAKWMLSQTNK
jgi:hypothetical protein